MIKDIIETLCVVDWSFNLQTVNLCKLYNSRLDLNGEMKLIASNEIEGDNFLLFNKNDLLVKSTLSVDSDIWEIAVYKLSDGSYISAATLLVNDDLLAVRLVSMNTVQFRNAQKELANILKNIDVSKIRVNVFLIGRNKFTSDVWKLKNGRLFCEDGICNIAVGENLVDVVDRLSKQYKLICKEEDKNYFKFKAGESIVQLQQLKDIILYAICDHNMPLYSEIREV